VREDSFALSGRILFLWIVTQGDALDYVLTAPSGRFVTLLHSKTSNAFDL